MNKLLHRQRNFLYLFVFMINCTHSSENLEICCTNKISNLQTTYYKQLRAGQTFYIMYYMLLKNVLDIFDGNNMAMSVSGMYV